MRGEMLTIRAAQTEGFSRQADEAFVERLVAYLGEEHAGEIVQIPQGVFALEEVPGDVLREMIRRGLGRASAYGLTWESSLTSFVVLMFVAAPNFDGHATVRRALRDESVPPNSRVDKLWECTDEADWEAIDEAYEPDAWQLPAGTEVSPLKKRIEARRYEGAHG